MEGMVSEEERRAAEEHEMKIKNDGSENVLFEENIRLGRQLEDTQTILRVILGKMGAEQQKINEIIGAIPEISETWINNEQESISAAKEKSGLVAEQKVWDKISTLPGWQKNL